MVERNRLLLDARNAASGETPETLMNRVCQLPYASQRRCSAPALARQVFQARLGSRRLRGLQQPPDIAVEAGETKDVAPSSYSYRMRSANDEAMSTRSRSAHPDGDAVRHLPAAPRRSAPQRRPDRHLRGDFDIALLSDEASLYDARSFAWFDGLYSVTLAERGTAPPERRASGVAERMRLHAHAGLRSALDRLIARFDPDIVHIEHIELAGLVTKTPTRARWLLGLHDAYGAGDFAREAAASAFRDEVLARYDMVTVCSAEDALLVDIRACGS